MNLYSKNKETIKSVEKFGSDVMDTSTIGVLMTFGLFMIFIKLGLFRLGIDYQTVAVLGKMTFVFENLNISFLIFIALGIIRFIGALGLSELKSWSIFMLKSVSLLLMILFLFYLVCYLKLALNHEQFQDSYEHLFIAFVLLFWIGSEFKFFARVSKIDIKELIAQQA